MSVEITSITTRSGDWVDEHGNVQPGFPTLHLGVRGAPLPRYVQPMLTLNLPTVYKAALQVQRELKPR